MTSGCTEGRNAKSYHWSGIRDFSTRERARLQQFPDEYEFCGTKTQRVKQLGNSIPPETWAIFMAEVVKTLKTFAFS